MGAAIVEDTGARAGSAPSSARTPPEALLGFP